MGLEFDGAVDAVNLGSPAALDNIWDGGATVCGWIFVRSFGEGDAGRLLDKSSDGGASDGWRINPNDSAFTAALEFIRDFSTTRGRWHSGDNTITLNQWIHVLLTYDSGATANDPDIYLGGVLATVVEVDTPVGAATDDSGELLTMGNLAIDDTVRGFDGFIADTRIYNRILSATEAAVIANGHGIDGIVNGLVARWPCSDSIDVSGQDFLSEAGQDTVGSSASLTLNVPGHEDGDTLIMVLASGGDAGGTPENITTPAGWTHINVGQTDLPATASTASVWVYRRTASSEPATYVVSGNQTTTKVGTIMSFKGIATSEDVSSPINTGTSTSPVAPSVVAGDNAMALRICCVDDGAITPDDASNFPAGINSRRAIEDTGVGNGVGLLVATELVDSGATGTRTFTITSDEWGCLTITFLGGQGATTAYLRDVSDNALPSNFQGTAVFREEQPPIKRRRMA